MRKTIHFFRSGWIAGLILFAGAVLVRLVPELKAGVWPVGYDTFNTYAADLANYSGHFFDWLRSANLLYFLFMPFKYAGLTDNATIKVVGVLLFATLILTVYLFARRTVKLNIKMSFLVGALLIFQLASLRISWDLFRNELGLIFFFLALINLEKISRPRNLFYLSVLSILVALSNQLVTAMLIVVLGIYFLVSLFKKQWATAGRLLAPGLLIALVFSMILSANVTLFGPHVLFTSETNNFGFYFYEYKKTMSYAALASLINQLFLVYYGWFIPLILLGFWLLRKNLILTAITLWLLAGTFSSLIFSGVGLIVWDRWLVMLVFPFMIYVIVALGWLGGLMVRWLHLSRGLSYGLAIILLTGLFYAQIQYIWPYLTATYIEARAPFANDDLNAYFPRTMVHNSVGIWKVQSTIDCLVWLNVHAPAGSVLIADNRYRGLALKNFELKDRYLITNTWSETLNDQSLQMARERGFWPIYLIWNTSKAIDGFDRIYAVKETGIYEVYTPTATAIRP